MKFQLLSTPELTLKQWQPLLGNLAKMLELEWSTWIPNVTASGGMTFTKTLTYFAEYLYIPWLESVIFSLRLDGTLVGPAGSTILISTPPAAPPSNRLYGGSFLHESFTAWITDSTPATPAVYSASDQSRAINLKRHDAANFVLGATGLSISGFYRVDG